MQPSSFKSVKCYFTLSANSAPALNFTTFFAGIVMVCFVAGLIPVLALFSLTAKVPKPIKAIFSPFANSSDTVSTKASSAFLASVLASRLFLQQQKSVLFCSWRFIINIKIWFPPLFYLSQKEIRHQDVDKCIIKKQKNKGLGRKKDKKNYRQVILLHDSLLRKEIFFIFVSPNKNISKYYIR